METGEGVRQPSEFLINFLAKGFAFAQGCRRGGGREKKEDEGGRGRSRDQGKGG